MEQETPSPETNASGNKDSRTIAMLCHLLGVFTSIVVPLILWIVKKDEDAFIDDQGKEALNFQITIVIAYFASIVLTIITVGLLAFLPFIVWIGSLVFGIIAALKANEGVKYRYPFVLRLIK